MGDEGSTLQFAHWASTGLGIVRIFKFYYIKNVTYILLFSFLYEGMDEDLKRTKNTNGEHGLIICYSVRSTSRRFEYLSVGLSHGG